MSDVRRTEALPRRVGENVGMAALMTASRVLLATSKIREVKQLAELTANTLRLSSPLREHYDTLARSRALAYRWSRVVPGCSCLHRALSTQVFLAAYRIQSKIAFGIRRRELLEGHAWLEVYVDNMATLLFVEDDDPYEVEVPFGERAE